MSVSKLLLTVLALSGTSALDHRAAPALSRRDQGQPNTQLIAGTCASRPIQIVYSDLGNSFSVRLDGLNLESFATANNWGSQHLNTSCAVDVPIAVTPLHWAYLRNVTVRYSVRLQNDDSASYKLSGYMAGAKFTDVFENFKGPINPNDGSTDVRLDSTPFKLKKRVRSICGVNTHLKMFITSELNLKRKIYGRDSRLELMTIDGQLDQVPCTEDGLDVLDEGGEFEGSNSKGHIPSEETLESSLAPILSAANSAQSPQNYFYSEPVSSASTSTNSQQSQPKTQSQPQVPAKPQSQPQAQAPKPKSPIASPQPPPSPIPQQATGFLPNINSESNSEKTPPQTKPLTSQLSPEEQAFAWLKGLPVSSNGLPPSAPQPYQNSPSSISNPSLSPPPTAYNSPAPDAPPLPPKLSLPPVSTTTNQYTQPLTAPAQSPNKAPEDLAGSTTELPAPPPPGKADHHFSISTHLYTGNGYSHSYFSSSSLTEAQYISAYPIFPNSLDHTFLVSGTSLRNYAPPNPPPPGAYPGPRPPTGRPIVPIDPYPFLKRTRPKPGWPLMSPRPQFTDIVPYDNRGNLPPRPPSFAPKAQTWSYGRSYISNQYQTSRFRYDLSQELPEDWQDRY